MRLRNVIEKVAFKLALEDLKSRNGHSRGRDWCGKRQKKENRVSSPEQEVVPLGGT